MAGFSTAGLGLTVLAGAALTVMVHPAIGLPLSGMALAALVLSRRSFVAVVAIVLSTVAAAFLAARFDAFVVGIPLMGVPLTARAPYVFGGLIAALLVLVGPAAAGLLRRRSALGTVGVLATAMAALQAAALVALADGAGEQLGAYAASAMRSVASQFGVGEELAKGLVAMWPAALVSTTGLIALLAVMGAGWIAARQGIALQRVPALAELDLDPSLTLLPIGGIALVAFGKLAGDGPWLTLAGENVLVVSSWVFFVQGMAVFAGLYRKAKVPAALQAFGFVLLFVTESFVPVVSITGLADVWVNIRRLPRKGQPDARPEASSGVD